MRKKIIGTVLCVITPLGIMLAEYRFIMRNQYPYAGENGTIHIELFGRVDEYYAEPYNN